MLLEVCIDSVESAIAAQRGGARRVELCADLLEGGITPSAGLIATVRSRISIGLYVMIRPRGGDFCYSDLEFEGMREEIKHAKSLGADGIVLGLLDPDARIDIPRTHQLVQLACPLPVTFHRAIDMTPDLPIAVEAVIQTGATRILSSGGAADACSGMSTLTQMVQLAKERIVIMPGGGVSKKNVEQIAKATRAKEFHAGLRSLIESPMRFRKEGIAMGSVPGREFSRYEVREENVRALVACLERMS
jgi:copper homeostasis protein